MAGAANSSLSDAWKMLVVKYACCGTFTFTFYETFLTLPEEERLIWKMPKSSPTRWLYFFSKYFALAVQMGNTITTFVLHNRYPLARQTCITWFIFRVNAAHILLICIELILMIRVHRLYEHNAAVAWVLRSLLLAEIALMISTAVIMQRSLEFSNACLIVRSPHIVMYFGSGGIITHISILILTIFPALSRRGWRRIPIINHLIRDGIAGFLVISALLSLAMLYRQEVASVVFSSFISVISCVGCRLIINLCKKAQHTRDTESIFPLSTSILIPDESISRSQGQSPDSHLEGM